MKTWLIAVSAFGGIFVLDIIRLSAVILKKNMEADGMPEYIEREAAIKALLNDATEQVGYSREDAADCIRYMDVADVAPVQHGKWEPGNPICPVCGGNKFKDLDADIWCDWQPDFCPNCGAKTDRSKA